MKRLVSRLGLPLLAKELAEQAARKRTYIVRVAYASLMFLAAYMMFYDTLRHVGSSPTAVLGRGRQMFDILVGLQFAGIYLFAPALTCGLITYEKERASLQLLFLTRLGPWTILFEKLLSRLVPIVGFQMLSLPLLAFAYSLGGISPQHLAGGVWMLLVSALQTASLGLACSTYLRTTAGAFVWSYLLGTALFLGPEFLWSAIGAPPRQLPVEIRFPFCGAALFFGGANTFGVTTPLSELVAALVHAVPLLFSSGVCLVLSRYFLVSRAFAPPRHLVLDLFRRLDGAFARWNENRWTKGIVLIADVGSLPIDQPIAWRETTKRSLGRARYLIRLFLVLEVPLLAFCLLLVIAGLHQGREIVAYVVFLLWGIAVLMVSVQAASLISAEKSHQTLDVLCTTPLSSSDIIRQKYRGVQRLMAVLLVPFFTLFVFQAWWRSMTSGFRWSYDRPFEPMWYLFSEAVTVGIYLPMVAWLSLWIGLKAKTQARAIIGSLAAIVGWCLLPFLCCVFPVAWTTRGGEEIILIILSSPMAMIIINEVSGPGKIFESPLPLIMNSMFYGGALFFFRQLCLMNADQLLGRTADGVGPPPGPARDS
ncbi:MAG: hypothetical protein HY290_09120 [Planctomycetia bacterium]|nr:hypothetical protein [Planctomycetia bacterium]